MFGWEKKDMENITPKELKVYRLLARRYLEFTEDEICIAVDDGTLPEFRQPQ
jgi:putative transcriptional regulator